MKAARGKLHHGIAHNERLHSSVARDLGIAIVTGHYQPGEILAGEHAASDQLRISRPAYREAIRMLAAKGLVESRPKAGTRVCARDQWNLLDPEVLSWVLQNNPKRVFLDELFELRMIVEPAAAALAAGRRSERDLRVMKSALADMARHEPDSPRGQAADQLFHETLLAAAGNEMLIKLASIISASVGYVAEFKREQHVPRDPRPDHEALLKAIEERRASEARKVMLRLIEHARADTSTPR